MDIHMALTPLPPSAGVHLDLIPLCVDIINGWPLVPDRVKKFVYKILMYY